MRGIKIAEDFVPVSEFKAQAAEWFRKAAASGAPVVVTQNGKPAGVLLSPHAYDALVERARFVNAVEDGLAQADAGRGVPHAAVVREARSRYGRKPR